jgi:hypothetical protein
MAGKARIKANERGWRFLCIIVFDTKGDAVHSYGSPDASISVYVAAIRASSTTNKRGQG